MPETTNITAAASAAQQQADAQLGKDTLSSLKELEKKLQSMGGAMDKVSTSVDALQSWFMGGKNGTSENFESAVTSSLNEADRERRLNDQALRMDEETRKMTRGGPQRGDADFWAKAYAPVEKSPLQMQTEAMVATFTNDSVKDKLKDIFSSPAVKSSLKDSVDDRGFGQKALDYVGLGGLGKIPSFFKDRNLRKEEKADQKDQVLIKREKTEQDRLKAALRKEMGKKGGGDEDRIAKLQEKYAASLNKVEEARQRREARTADPFADLMEMKDGLFAPKKATPATPGQHQAQPVSTPATPGQGLRQEPAAQPGLFSKVSDYIRGEGGRKADKESDIAGKASLEEDQSYVPVSKVTGDKSEPVELAKTDGKAPKAGDAKEAADIQRKLDTQLRPDFYKEGTAFFKKYLNEDLGGKKEESGGGMGGLGKAGVYAAAAAAVGASIYKIGQAAMLTKEWLNTAKEQKAVRNQIYDQGAEAQENMKKGWNDEMRDAGAELSRAEKELDNSNIFTRGKARKRVEELKKKYEQELEKTRKFTAAARAKGIKADDTEAMNKFKTEYDAEQKAKAEEAARTMKAGVNANYNLSLPGQKPAAGSLDQGAAPNLVMPGANVDTGKVETTEDQVKRIEQATYEGMKRAMTDPEIKQMNEENARATGKQINESLVGRK